MNKRDHECLNRFCKFEFYYIKEKNTMKSHNSTPAYEEILSMKERNFGFQILMTFCKIRETISIPV